MSFTYHKHKWEAFVLSFHKDNFCYSGHCSCHDKDFDEKGLPYELLDGLSAITMMKLENEETVVYALPMDRERVYQQIMRLGK